MRGWELLPDTSLQVLVPAREVQLCGECNRVLAPGGVLVFQELPISWRATKQSAIEKALVASRQIANNEPHFVDCAQRDTLACAREAGFAHAQERVVASSTAPWGKWYLLEAKKAVE